MRAPRKIELLSPAKNIEVAKAAIEHGADAVYIGPDSFGARAAAANSIDDIRRLVDYAHPFRVKVYATVNTIVREREIKDVESLISMLYRAGVDALIVQDMGILRLDIPPIQLHASTQCDTRTVEKARFLQDVGFSQIVLARELGLDEISSIADSVEVPIEVFIHGALCVSYSGRCHASYSVCGRSANRGECAQICRWKYNLVDASGNNVATNKHLLSLKDFNASDQVANLLRAGVSSFKIEGRLKDATYVKNVTAYYRTLIDNQIELSAGAYERSSCGSSKLAFTPKLDKSFNRGFTHYFLTERRPVNIASLQTPKSLGEPVESISDLHNGDGISFFDKSGAYQGLRVNKVVNGKIVSSGGVRVPSNAQLYRTFDVEWEKVMNRPTAERRIAVDIRIDETIVYAKDERGCEASLSLADIPKDKALKRFDPRPAFEKLGASKYKLRNFESMLLPDTFIPISSLSEVRRRLIDLVDKTAEATYQYEYRRCENKDAIFPTDSLNSGSVDYRENVANSYAREFYRSHGVTTIGNALETESPSSIPNGSVLMTCRHCILREIGRCKKDKKLKDYKEPLFLVSDSHKFRLEFDCKRCEMKVLKD